MGDSALQSEQQVILHQVGFVFSVHGRCKFHEHADAVALADFYVRSLVARFSPQIHAIDVHAESALVAAFQPDVRTAYAVAALIVHPESPGCRGNGRKYRVEPHRVGGE